MDRITMTKRRTHDRLSAMHAAELQMRRDEAGRSSEARHQEGSGLTMATTTDTIPTVRLYQARIATGGPTSPCTREKWCFLDEGPGGWVSLNDLDLDNAIDPPAIDMITWVETPLIMWGDRRRATRGDLRCPRRALGPRRGRR